MQIKPGDRIKLTEHGARVSSKKNPQRGRRVDWYMRRGTAERVGKLYVYVRWDGCRSTVSEMPSLIELAED